MYSLVPNALWEEHVLPKLIRIACFFGDFYLKVCIYLMGVFIEEVRTILLGTERILE